MNKQTRFSVWLSLYYYNKNQKINNALYWAIFRLDDCFDHRF